MLPIAIWIKTLIPKLIYESCKKERKIDRCIFEKVKNLLYENLTKYFDQVHVFNFNTDYDGENTHFIIYKLGIIINLDYRPTLNTFLINVFMPFKTFKVYGEDLISSIVNTFESENIREFKVEFITI